MGHTSQPSQDNSRSSPFGSMELIKCQDVAVGLDLFITFSNGDSSDVCHLLCYIQGQLPTSDCSFVCVQSFM